MKLAGAREVENEGGYQVWEPSASSHILNVAVASWEKLYGVKPIVEVIHAGLECGLFLQARPDMDMISYGPTLVDVHSPQERCHIPAVQKGWDFTLDIIKTIAAGK
jgi:dipeptidase D